MTETLLGVSPPLSTDPAGPPSAEELAAAKELVRQARAQGVALTGPGGLLKALTKTVIESALEEEMAEHLGYDNHDFSQDVGNEACWRFSPALKRLPTSSASSRVTPRNS
jgi:hypothetical protein